MHPLCLFRYDTETDDADAMRGDPLFEIQSHSYSHIGVGYERVTHAQGCLTAAKGEIRND